MPSSTALALRTANPRNMAHARARGDPTFLFLCVSVRSASTGSFLSDSAPRLWTRGSCYRSIVHALERIDAEVTGRRTDAISDRGTYNLRLALLDRVRYCRRKVRDVNRDQRLVLSIAVGASFVAFMNNTVITVALPRITADLGGGLAGQQWLINAYLVTLGSLILVAGSVSDTLGRGRVLRVGLVGFAIASAAISLAPTVEFMIAFRALQGAAGAFLVPSSLALITSTFRDAAQATVIMIIGSFGIGSLSSRFGARVFMTVGPLMMAVGSLLLLTVSADFNYWVQVLPGVVVFGAGLTVTVSPLTSAVLGSVPSERAGTASAINNAVARLSSLVIVAVLAVIVGGQIDLSGFHRAAVVTAALLAAGALASWVGIRAAVAPSSRSLTSVTAEPCTASDVPMPVGVARTDPKHA